MRSKSKLFEGSYVYSSCYETSEATFETSTISQVE